MIRDTTRAVVDLNAVGANVHALRSIISPETRLMAVVKADAYGHGCVRVSQTVLSNGADHLGVARIEEGIRLRKSGISASVLVFGHIAEPDLPALFEYELTPTAYSLAAARSISAVSSRFNKTIPIHVKVDTGMGRLGLSPENTLAPTTKKKRVDGTSSIILEISKLPGIKMEGIYTHFATADSPDCTNVAGAV
jgi:alanine racemase